MSNKNLTKTLFADFRKVDTKKLNINGNPFSKVVSDNVPESPTENDIWKYAVTTDDNGVVTIADDVTVDYTELTDALKAITQTAVKVIDNKVLDANDTLLMNWDTENFTNESNSSMVSIFGGTTSKKAPITEWNSDLSSLTSGNSMFSNTALTSFNGDLSSLTSGGSMFYGTALTSFNGNLSSLTQGRDMFCNSTLTSFNGNLSSLTYGLNMFYNSTLQSFNIDLSSLTDGYHMFFGAALTSFSGDLSSLTQGWNMFRNTALESFNSDLSSLIKGTGMFYGTALTSFSGDMPSLTDGLAMFASTALESFNGDLSSLTNGVLMFSYNQPRHYGVTHYKIVDGIKTKVAETFVSNGLKAFISNLSFLKSGYGMFGEGNDVTYTYTDDNGSEVTETTKDVAPLDEESIMLIAYTINDISSLDKTVDSDWTYTSYDWTENLTTLTISSSRRGILHLGYDTTITDTSKIMKYCDQIANKGWTVYLNGATQVANNGVIETISLTNEDGSAVPYYYKPLQVTDENVAEYVDTNGNYYIIIGGQHVFGDDISTYGTFTSYDHAVSEITLSLGLTKYTKPTESTEEK